MTQIERISKTIDQLIEQHQNWLKESAEKPWLNGKVFPMFTKSTGLNLQQAYMCYTQAIWNTFTDCNFMYANLSDMNFGNSTFINCNFRFANLEGVNFRGCSFENCDFGKAKTDSSTMWQDESTLAGLNENPFTELIGVC